MLPARRVHMFPYLATVAAGCSLSLIAGIGTAAASTENPVTDALGFNLFVLDDVRFGSNEAEGAVAGGGDLSVASDYRVNVHANAQFNDIGLLMGGKVDWGAFGPAAHIDVLDGTVKIGDATGTEVFQPGVTTLVPTGAGSGSPKKITIAHVQSASTIFESNLIDFHRAFATFGTLSAGYGDCTQTVTLTDAGGTPLPRPITTTEQAYLALNPDAQNVLTITPDELDHISSLTFRSPPTATGPLIVNVDTSGTGGIATFTPPTPAGISGNNAPYILWNFPGASKVTINGANVLEGSVYAPSADLVDNMTNNIEGTVIAKSYDQSGVVKLPVHTRELHYFPFNTTLTTCGETPTQTPTETPTETPSETPTETPTTAPPTTPTETTTPTTTPSPSHSTPQVPSSAPAPTSTGSHLASTGASHSGLLVTLAAVLTLGGSALTIATRRRRLSRRH